MNNDFCKFCNKLPSDISSSVEVELIYYNFGLVGRYTHNFSKIFNGLPEVTLGSQNLRVNIPRCKECLQKHKSISFFDFSTEKNAKFIVKEQLKLYIENGYKIEWLYIDSSLTLNSSNKYPTISFEKSIFYKDIISFITIILKIHNLFDKQSIMLFHEFLEIDLRIPEHELFIFTNHIKKEITFNHNIPRNDVTLIISKIITTKQDKRILSNLIDFLFEIYIFDNKDLENRLKELFYLEKVFGVNSIKLNSFRE